MLDHVTIGQYIPTGSVLHRMDARVKIILLFVYLVLLFTISQPAAYLLISAATVGLVFLSKVSPRFVLRGLKPMLLILLITTLFNLFLTPGEAIWEFSPFGAWNITITREGIRIAVMMFLRLLFLVMISSLLTLTTSPMMLTDAIERLLRPLECIRVPAHEIAMMMTIAIRFIPTLAEEADKIMKAQTARGADFESGNLIKRTKAMIPLLVPLFVSAFRRADELATAMDARCYHGGKNRTRMKESKVTRLDVIAIVCVVLFAGILFLCNQI
ncbi:MAG: energy-coupling factor transporter transmembrane protein EcfT [Ruminococcaceae bacterium]|nr:energy-coupling factor transporter transmembrane protein EcfT [Oscillospiraceae bacterium]